MQYFKKDRNIDGKIILMKVIKTIMEFFKDEYKRVLREEVTKKPSENGSTFRKNSKGRYNSIKGLVRRNSTNKQEWSELNVSKESSKNRALDNYLSNQNIVKCHKRSNHSTIPLAVVQKVNTSNRNSMIGDWSAIPIQPWKSLKSIIPKRPNSKTKANTCLDKSKLETNIIFMLKSKQIKNMIYLLVKSMLREISVMHDTSEHTPKSISKLICEARRLASQYIILENTIINNMLPKKLKQDNKLNGETLVMKYSKYGIFKHLLKLYDTQSDIRHNISSESPVVLRFEEDELPIEEYKDLSKILELWASQKESLELLNDNLTFVMEKLLLFLSDDSDLKTVIWPASTVLLDLTANEPSINLVANFMHQNRMLIYVIKKTKRLLEKTSQNLGLKEVEFRNKIRDLYIGIILNLTWNVDNERIGKFLIDNGAIKLVKQ
jgi:hypothetical protein